MFIAYVNDICGLTPDSVVIKLFADDTKLYSVFNDDASPDDLQSCLTAISDWSDHWQLKLSPTKCTVLRVSPVKHNSVPSTYTYHIGNVALPVVDRVTDLGVTYDNTIKFAPHIDSIVSKAAFRAKSILSCFCSRDPSLLLRAFTTFVRPILEYCCTVWSPVLKYQINKIENVQRRFTKSLSGLCNLSYQDRLHQLGLDTLYCRRIKADLVMCFSMLNNLVCIDSDAFFTRLCDNRTRGHSLKLSKSHIVSVRDGHLFCNRVINTWNALPDSIVSATSVSVFKRKIAPLSF